MMRAYRSVDLTEDGPRLVTRTVDAARRLEQRLVLRPLKVGVCRSDIKEVAGTRAMRRDFGHEVVAVVDELSATDVLPPGAIVGFDPHVPISRTSGFAEYMIASANRASLQSAFPILPASMNLDRAVFVEPLACAHHSVERLSDHLRCFGTEDLSGLPVAIIGAGTAGVLQALILKARCAEIKLVNRSEARLSMLARASVLPRHNLMLLQACRTGMFDAVVISTSFVFPEILEQSLRLLRLGGIALIFGGTNPGQQYLAIDLDRLRRTEALARVVVAGGTRWLGGTYGATGDDVAAAIGLLTAGGRSLPVEKLITSRAKLAELPAQLARLASETSSYVGKMVVDVA